MGKIFLTLLLFMLAIKLFAGESSDEKKARLLKEKKSAELAQNSLNKATKQFLSYRFGNESYEILHNRLELLW